MLTIRGALGRRRRGDPKRWRRIVASLALAAGVLAGFGTTTGRAEPQEIRLDGGRRYALHMPSALPSEEALPAVAVLAGSGTDAGDVLALQGWIGTADASGFVAIGLEALPVDTEAPPQPMRNPRIWRDGSEAVVGAMGADGLDDVAYVAAALADAARRHPIDPKRIYLVGFAGGGSMVQRLGMEMAERFAAAASVAGHLRVPVRRAGAPLPLMLIFGGRDPMVPLEGGHAPGLGRTDGRLPSVKETIRRWVTGLDCPFAPAAAVDGPRIERRLWAPCAGDAELAVILVRDLGHHWPGGGGGLLPERIAGPTSDALDATGEIWAFLKRHRRGTGTAP